MKKLIALTGAFLASSAFAAVSNNAAVSNTSVSSSTWEDFKEKTHVSYFVEANKASVESEAPDAFVYNSISGRYKLNDMFTLRADARFSMVDNAKDRYKELNPRVGIQGVTYANGNFSVFSSAVAEIGATDKANENDMLAKAKFYNAAAYTMGPSSISAGLEFSRWFYDNGNEPGDNAKIELYSDISYRYTIDDTATFQAFYEVVALNRADQSTGDMTQDFNRFLVGMDFTIAKGTTLYPHIEYNPQDDREAQDLGVGAWFSTKFF